MADDLTDVIHTLEQRRAEHVRQAGLLDQAIASLQALAGAGPPAVKQAFDEPSPIVDSLPPKPAGPSVSRAVIDLADEADRDWSPDEMLTEFKKRDTPFGVADLQNSVFSALSRAQRKGALVRVSTGRYRSAKFTTEQEPVSQQQERFSEVREKWLSGSSQTEVAAVSSP